LFNGEIVFYFFLMAKLCSIFFNGEIGFYFFYGEIDVCIFARTVRRNCAAIAGYAGAIVPGPESPRANTPRKTDAQRAKTGARRTCVSAQSHRITAAGTACSQGRRPPPWNGCGITQ
jgi:hypothetical protein